MGTKQVKAADLGGEVSLTLLQGCGILIGKVGTAEVANHRTDFGDKSFPEEE